MIRYAFPDNVCIVWFDFPDNLMLSGKSNQTMYSVVREIIPNDA